MEYLIIFVRAGIQIGIMSVVMSAISQNNLIAVILGFFCLCYIWAINVRKMSMTNSLGRLVYALGGTMGGTLGYLISNI